MAEGGEILNGEVNGGDATHDLQALLSGEGRDFLIRNNGDQVRSKHNSYYNNNFLLFF